MVVSSSVFVVSSVEAVVDFSTVVIEETTSFGDEVMLSAVTSERRTNTPKVALRFVNALTFNFSAVTINESFL